MLKTYKLYLALIGLLLSFPSFSQLNPGEIAFIGIHTDANDQFTWISLTDIPAGEEIYFTDKGWHSNSSNWFANTEGHILWTAPSGGLSCGTIVHITESNVNTFTINTGVGTIALASGTWSQSGGDQVLAYQSLSGVEPAAPSFIAGIHGDYNSADYNSATTWCNGVSNINGSCSQVPTGLTNGVNCVSLYPAPGPELDNNRYTGTLTGTSTALLAAINDRTNWTVGSDLTIPVDPSQYPSPSITCAAPCAQPTIPSVTASPNSICPGGSSTLTFSGVLNDATQWHIYTGSCAGTQIGTSTGSTFVVSPASTTTYFVRGEGGCTTPGSCGTITVSVGDLTNPTISCPGNQTGTVSSACNFTIPDYTPMAMAFDNCTASPTVTQSPTPGTSVGAGTTVIILTATDGSSNSANCSFNVVVSDNTPPTAICQNITILLDGAGNATIVAADINSSSTDNCGPVTLSASNTAFTCANIGANNVILTVTDGNANIDNCTAVVTVVDPISPVADIATLADVNAQCEVTTLTSPTATDNCTGAVTVTNDASLPISSTTVVTWTYDDGNGNTSTQTQNVVINDDTAPIADLASLADETGTCEVTPTSPLATDNCTGSITGISNLTFPITAIGTTVVTWTYDDGNGNTVTQTQNVIVSGVETGVTENAGTLTADATGVTYQWLDCDAANAVIVGETNVSFTPTSDGNYAVEINDNSCLDTSACFFVDFNGLNDLDLIDISIYPNPSMDGSFTISYEGTIEAIDVVDMFGRVIELPIELATGTVDGSELADGRYMVNVTTDKSVLTTEIVIAR